MLWGPVDDAVQKICMIDMHDYDQIIAIFANFQHYLVHKKIDVELTPKLLGLHS